MTGFFVKKVRNLFGKQRPLLMNREWIACEMEWFACCVCFG